jgi:hypothetical protein
VHALEALDNHYDAVVTDTLGTLPDFMAWVHRKIAKCLNEIYGRKRPDFHFGRSDEQWAEVECRDTVPPQLRDAAAEHIVGELDRMIAERERTIRSEAGRAGKSFVGEKRLLNLDPFDSPKTPHRKGKLNPRFAAGTAEGQKRGREMLHAFRSAYREAFGKWRTGARAMFPAGTFGLARLARVLCAGLDTARPALNSG